MAGETTVLLVYFWWLKARSCLCEAADRLTEGLTSAGVFLCCSEASSQEVSYYRPRDFMLKSSGSGGQDWVFSRRKMDTDKFNYVYSCDLDINVQLKM